MTIRDILKLDIRKKDDYKYIPAKQYDTHTRFLDIELCDDGIPMSLKDGITARVRGTKPDNTYFIIDGTIRDNSIVTIELTKEMLNVAGRVVCDIGLYEPANTGNTSDDKLLSSSIFYLVVDKSAYDENAVLSSNEFQTLTELIAENRILGEELDEKISKATELIEQMQQILHR